jgi:hypothetical protein
MQPDLALDEPVIDIDDCRNKAHSCDRRLGAPVDIVGLSARSGEFPNQRNSDSRRYDREISTPHRPPADSPFFKETGWHCPRAQGVNLQATEQAAGALFLALGLGSDCRRGLTSGLPPAVCLRFCH